MNRVMILGLVGALALVGPQASADPLGDCAQEPALQGRDDVVMCEPWENGNWWSQNGYSNDGGLPPFPDVTTNAVEHTSIITSGCKTGSCLKVDTPVNVNRSLNIHWPLINAGIEPQELYFRYYFKIGDNWTPNQCNDSGVEVWPPSGKFPGLGDTRMNSDPVGQCGNGGASSDGINCWSARGVFQGCSGGLASSNFPYDNTCEFTPNARVRIGSYLYLPDTTASHGAPGVWDAVAERNNLGADYSSSCRRDDPLDPDPNCYCGSSNNMYCGLGFGGQLVTGRWYAIEMYVKMNTPGVADGVIRGWVDDVLSYEKDNVLFRKVGHDNLHVRTVWLNVYKGGVEGNCETSALYYDQMVVATEKIGELDAGPRPNPPGSFDVGP